MVRIGVVLFLLGFPGLILFVIPGLILFVLGGSLVVIGLLSNAAKAGAGVGKFAAKSVIHSATTQACPDCGTAMPKAAVLCLSCGYRVPAAVPAPTADSPTTGSPAN
jgi:hypothetical protein